MKKKNIIPQYRRSESHRCASLIEIDEKEAGIRIFILIFNVIVSYWVAVDEPWAKTPLDCSTGCLKSPPE